MTLAPGVRVGPYEITGSLGAGGMGEVYRATDTNLGRQVAIKVLPEALASDADRLARFDREARTLASLNHPSIAAIYGLERSAGTTALVMELIEGPTLADRITGGAIPVDEALPIAKQIAEALEAAHDSGIVHRDLKPANIKLRPDGVVKVLDFGLAKAMDSGLGTGDSGLAHATQAPTITTPAMMTGVGIILGTAAYMSPEQARGKPVDRRTDIWAFGCVLYEMLTGRRAFAGDDVSDTIANVLKTEPRWSDVPGDTPPAILTMLRRCLRKEQQRRLADAGAVRIEIDEALAGSATQPADALEAGRGRRHGAVVALAMVFAAGITGVVLWNRRPPSPLPVVRTVVTLPAGEQLAGDGQPAVALSPDGRVLAYVASRGGTSSIFLRGMDSFESMAAPDTEGASNPFFSPDGQWLGFFADGKLKKISVNGSTSVTLADAINPRGASWGNQGTIAFAPTNASPILLVPETGGTPQPLTGGRHPELLPGGAVVLFETSGGIEARVLETGDQRNVVQAGAHPRYVASGHLVYAQGGSLMAAPFDPQQLEITGTAAVIVEDVLQYPSTGAAQYSISSNGTLVYMSGEIQQSQSTLVWVSRSGVEQPLAAPERSYGRPRLSPDGRRVALSFDGRQVWLYDTSNGTLTRSTLEGTSNNFPLWTPDGKRIVFNSNREGPLNLFWQSSDGSGSIERLASSEYTQAAMSWSPDGQVLAFTEINPTTGYDIWVLRLSDRRAQPFLRTPFTEGAPHLSPDGRWMAYTSDESGRFEIYVQPFPGPGGKWQVSTDGGTEPMWNRNGRELFYRRGETMMAVDIAADSSLVSSRPRMLFDGPYRPSPFPLVNYDVSSDGRFLMLKPSEQQETAATQINVVQNWLEELKRLVPTN